MWQLWASVIDAIAIVPSFRIQINELVKLIG